MASFAIEVPGEAVPLNFPDLCKALQAGTSTDHAQRQTASAQLKEWEVHPEYFVSLQVRSHGPETPLDLGQLALG